MGKRLSLLCSKLEKQSLWFFQVRLWVAASDHAKGGGTALVVPGSSRSVSLGVLRACEDEMSYTAFLLPQSLKKVGQDSVVLLICITVFLSYLPEAGQYSSFFLYLRQVTPRFGSDPTGVSGQGSLRCCRANTERTGGSWSLKASSS